MGAEIATSVWNYAHGDAGILRTFLSERFWAKILHCARVAPWVFDAAFTRVECSDWIPSVCDIHGASPPRY